jgi:hypothetical protein
VFEVYLDNVLAYTSGTMTPTSATKSINLSVAGKNQMKLVVTIAATTTTATTPTGPVPASLPAAPGSPLREQV